MKGNVLTPERQQQHGRSILARADDASSPSYLRDLRSECHLLLKKNGELAFSKDAMRMQASAWRKKAEAATKDFEAERKARAKLTRTRESLQAAAVADNKTIARLQAQLCKGTPSSQLLERARCLKRTKDRLQDQLDAQNVALSAKTAELEIARREARELAAALEVKGRGLTVDGTEESATADDMLELGRARTTCHDLALELARVSEISEALTSGKEEMRKSLQRTEEELERCRAETDDLRKSLERAREEASETQDSTREARELLGASKSREKELHRELESAERREAVLAKEISTLGRAVERGESMAARIEAMQTELQVCEVALFDERKQKERISTDLQASNEALRLARLRLKTLRGAEQEKARLANLLEHERASEAALREETNAAREQLRLALAAREELLRGLRQAKTYNDQLAKEKDIAEEREREASARSAETRDGKLAMQRALLEQLSAARAAFREERERRQEAEATLQALTADAGAESEAATASKSRLPTRTNGEAAERALVSDEEYSVSSLEVQEGAAFFGPPSGPRPRDTLVQDYLGREGAEQFLSDWDEERSSTSDSCCSLIGGASIARQPSREKTRKDAPPPQLLPLRPRAHPSTTRKATITDRSVRTGSGTHSPDGQCHNAEVSRTDHLQERQRIVVADRSASFRPSTEPTVSPSVEEAEVVPGGGGKAHSTTGPSRYLTTKEGSAVAGPRDSLFPSCVVTITASEREEFRPDGPAGAALSPDSGETLTIARTRDKPLQQDCGEQEEVDTCADGRLEAPGQAIAARAGEDSVPDGIEVRSHDGSSERRGVADESTGRSARIVDGGVYAGEEGSHTYEGLHSRGPGKAEMFMIVDTPEAWSSAPYSVSAKMRSDESEVVDEGARKGVDNIMETCFSSRAAGAVRKIPPRSSLLDLANSSMEDI